MDKILLLLFLALIVVFVIKRKRPKETDAASIRGLQGEMEVNKILQKLNLPYFHDTLLVDEKYSNQFDHIVVLKNGLVLVIETKNRAGNIKVPHDEMAEWQQLVGDQINRFYSPLAQNRGHINMLDIALKKRGFKNVRFESIVVFTDQNSKIIGAPYNVIKLEQLESYIKHRMKWSLFNKSGPIIKAINKLDNSKNNRKVQKHINTAKRKQK